MDKKELGRLIKEARLAKKMTQSEVVGSFITRNMLSQIESGSAIPSIKTLQYLSERLDISIHMLSQDEQAEKTSVDEAGGNYTQFKLMREAKDNYSAGNYTAAIDSILPFLNDDSVYADELYAIYSMCCLAASKKRDESKEQALHYATEAMLYADRGFFASHERKTEALFLVEKLSK